MRIPSADAEGGYGLVLVDALTDAWGVQPAGNGKLVWIELRTGTPVDTASEPEPRQVINSLGPARPPDIFQVDVTVNSLGNDSNHRLDVAWFQAGEPQET